MVRSIGLLVCAAACGSVLDRPTDPSVGVVIEAESYSSITMPMTYSWTVETDPTGYTGAGFMQGQPATGAGCSMGDVLSCAPSMVYSIQLAQPGVYFFHARILATTMSDDSIWYGVDGVRNLNAMFFGEPPLTWHWRTGDSFALQAGPHMLHVWLRDPGARVDVVALTESSQPP